MNLPRLILAIPASLAISTIATGGAGTRGRDGMDGFSASAQRVTADGSTHSVDAIGRSGTAGDNGGRGSYPFCKNQSDVPYNVWEADGSHGGEGGRGGNGGRGGDVTVVFSEPTQLKEITIKNSGGFGGMGGRGGQGSNGCYCRRSSWTYKDSSGSEKTYSCYQGRDGRDGMDGSFGRRGDHGELFLINTATTVNAPNSLTLTISQAVAATHDLARSTLEKRTGARVLFSPASDIPDTYYLHNSLQTAQFKVIWLASDSIEEFGNVTFTISLQENGEISVAFPPNIEMSGRISKNGNVAEYIVERAVNHRAGRQCDEKQLAICLQYNGGTPCYVKWCH